MHLKNNKLISELKLVQWNCFKLDIVKLAELRIFIDEHRPDVISLQEVKLNQEEANLFLRFDSYTVHYKPRRINPSRGGGVAIIVKDSINHTRINGLDEKLSSLGRN